MLFGLSPCGSRILRRALPPGLAAPFRALSLRLPQACACAIRLHRTTRRLRCIGTALFSAAFRRLAPVDRLPNSRVKLSGFRRHSLPRLTCRSPIETAVAGCFDVRRRFQLRLRSRFQDRRSTRLFRQDGTCDRALSLRQAHRQAGCASARLCAFPRSRFCYALPPPYTADGSTLHEAPCASSLAR